MHISLFTSPGVRDHNEDTIYPEPGQPIGDLFIIADGLGGHADGKIASELACQVLRQILEREDPAAFVLGGHRMSEPDLMQAFLSDAVRQAGVTLWHEARQHGSDMGSTLLVVLIKNGRGYCAHVGDCALFVSEADQMPPAKLTTEHRRGASLTRSLGAQEQVTPDVFSFAFDDASALVMGCDGFWEYVAAERIGQLLRERPPFCVADELGRAALEAGSQDNVSVIVVEGDTFVARHAVEQIEAYAAVLSKRADSPETEAQCRALLEFCTQAAAINPNVFQAIARLPRLMPAAAQVWANIRASLPHEVQDEVTRLIGAAAPSPEATQAHEFAAQGRHDADAGRAYRQYLAAYPDDATVRLHLAFSLIEYGAILQGFAELERALKSDPGIRDQAEAWLAARVRAIDAPNLRSGDNQFYQQYLKLVPGDVDVRYLYAAKLWASGDRTRAWNELRSLYMTHPNWRERTVNFLREYSASLDIRLLREVLDLAMQVRGPGAVWALKELARRDPDAYAYAQRCARAVAADWPIPEEGLAAKRWLADSSVPGVLPLQSAGGDLENLARIEQLERERAGLQRELEALKAKLGEQQNQFNELMSHWERSQRQMESYRHKARTLAHDLLQVWEKYPKQCESVLTRDVLQAWRDWLNREDVRPAPGAQPLLDAKKPPRWKR